MNILANALKIFMYFRIRYSNNRQSVFFKESGPFFVVQFAFFRIMPRAVKFNDKFCLGTVKIRYILPKNLLTRKTHRIGTQEIIPKMSFFLGHILSQHFRGWNNVFIVFSQHYNPSVTLRVPPPFTQGRLFYLFFFFTQGCLFFYLTTQPV